MFYITEEDIDNYNKLTDYDIPNLLLEAKLVDNILKKRLRFTRLMREAFLEMASLGDVLIEEKLLKKAFFESFQFAIKETSEDLKSMVCIKNILDSDKQVVCMIKTSLSLLLVRFYVTLKWFKDGLDENNIKITARNSKELISAINKSEYSSSQLAFKFKQIQLKIDALQAELDNHKEDFNGFSITNFFDDIISHYFYKENKEFTKKYNVGPIEKLFSGILVIALPIFFIAISVMGPIIGEKIAENL